MLAQTALFPLHELQGTSVRVCRHVTDDNHPILHVVRNGQGTWTFLCGRDHQSDHHEGQYVPLSELVKNDSTLNAVAELAPHDFAKRPGPGAPWTMGDQLAFEIPATIDEHGWFVALVNDDMVNPPTHFAYSIGLTKTYTHPEIIMMGRSPDSLPTIINKAGSCIKQGTPLADGQTRNDIISGEVCACKPVHSTWYRDYLGYALWYHGGEQFEVMQLFWADSEGRFPWDPNCDQSVVDAQPDLSRAKQ